MKKYFARANTSSGCVNLMKNNLTDIKNVYVVDGKSKAAKTKLMKTIADDFDRKSVEVECVVCPFDIKQYDAIIIRDLQFAVVDKCCVENDFGGIHVSTDEFLNMKKIETDEEYLEQLSEKADKEYYKLYDAYSVGKQVHDEWEKIYISRMDFEKLNTFGKQTIDLLINQTTDKKDTKRYERFFGASTVDGSVNYIDNLTNGLNRRYFIKGRPGTGKSTFLKRLANAANDAGFDVEVYYCSFDKNSLDMVVVRDLSFCVFDSTAPHEMFPSEKRDMILDFYKESGLEGTDEKFAKQLELIHKRYQYRVTEGLCNLRLGNAYTNEREYYYGNITNFDEVTKLADKIVRKIAQ